MESFRDIAVLLHALAASVGVGAVITTDYMFFGFLKDKRISKKEVRILKIISQVIWIALIILILSGIYLVLSKPELASSSKFLLKMVLVACLTVNGFILNFFLTPKLTHISFDEAHRVPGDFPDVIRKIAVVIGGISIISWLAAFILGSIRVIPFSLSDGILGYLGVIILVFLFAQFKRKSA